MRVTIVSETYLPQVNGVSRTLAQLTRVLRESGDDVQLVHPDYGDGTVGDHDVLVRSEDIPFYRELKLPMPPFPHVHDAIERFGPDLVHIATEATLGLSILRFTARMRIPTVSSFHTNFDQYALHYGVGWLNGAVWRYMRWFHNSTRETYVPSLATMRQLEQRGFERLALWPRGVDCDHFSPRRPGRDEVRARLGFRPEHVVVGHVSRIAAEKNTAYLAAALERLIQRDPALVRVLVVGDGPARADLEAQLGPLARCVGYQTGEALADHFAACDVFAFASLTETFGNVILEAMASGLPVVAVRAGGPGEIVADGETGFLVEPTDSPDIMTDRLDRLVRDERLRQRMAQAARGHAVSQSWDAIMLRLRERYRAVLAANQTSAKPA